MTPHWSPALLPSWSILPETYKFRYIREEACFNQYNHIYNYYIYICVCVSGLPREGWESGGLLCCDTICRDRNNTAIVFYSNLPSHTLELVYVSLQVLTNKWSVQWKSVICLSSLLESVLIRFKRISFHAATLKFIFH